MSQTATDTGKLSAPGKLAPVPGLPEMVSQSADGVVPDEIPPAVIERINTAFERTTANPAGWQFMQFPDEPSALDFVRQAKAYCATVQPKPLQLRRQTVFIPDPEFDGSDPEDQEEVEDPSALRFRIVVKPETKTNVRRRA